MTTKIVGLCKYAQHISIFDYTAPGYSIEMKPESIAQHTYPSGTVWV